MNPIECLAQLYESLQGLKPLFYKGHVAEMDEESLKKAQKICQLLSLQTVEGKMSSDVLSEVGFLCDDLLHPFSSKQVPNKYFYQKENRWKIRYYRRLPAVVNHSDKVDPLYPILELCPSEGYYTSCLEVVDTLGLEPLKKALEEYLNTGGSKHYLQFRDQLLEKTKETPHMEETQEKSNESEPVQNQSPSTMSSEIEDVLKTEHKGVTQHLVNEIAEAEEPSSEDIM